MKLPKLGVLKEIGRAILSAADRRDADAPGNAPADPFGAAASPARLAAEFPLVRADGVPRLAAVVTGHPTGLTASRDTLCTP